MEIRKVSHGWEISGDVIGQYSTGEEVLESLRDYAETLGVDFLITWIVGEEVTSHLFP